MTFDDPRDRSIRDYVKRRGRHEVPPDLVTAIQRAVDRTPQRGRSWISWPTLGLAGVAAGILLAAVVLTVRPSDDIGGPPTATPGPTSAPTVSPTPSALQTPSPSPLPSPSPSAVPDDTHGPAYSLAPDEAFSVPDECENPAAGYRISLPDEWFYNTAFDDFDACQWFAPTSYSVTDASTVPPEVAIVLSTQDGGDFGPGGEVVSRDEYTVSGRPAVRYEIAGEPGGFAPERAVMWIIGLDGELPSEASTGRWLLGQTGTDRPGDFVANVEVLDRMIATIVVDER